ncbi:MAG TPA: ABC transporter permease [Ktedonobacterales bacterium]|jgi:osmoprotectant transport system permease protein
MRASATAGPKGGQPVIFQQMIQFIQDPQNTFATHTTDYLKLCFFSIALAVVIGIALGIAGAQRPALAFVATNLTGLARAIPTLAFLAIGLLYFRLGIGFRPSALALTLLGIPPVLLNTIAGLRGIDPAAVEAGRGMGMTAGQLLWRVRVPLVLPVVAAGVRTSAVQIVATAPLAALIGGGGYGDYILLGINLLQTAPLLVGAGCVAALALLVEAGLAAVQRAVTPVGLRVGVQAEEIGPGDVAPSAPPSEPVAA